MAITGTIAIMYCWQQKKKKKIKKSVFKIENCDTKYVLSTPRNIMSVVKLFIYCSIVVISALFSYALYFSTTCLHA